MPNGDRIRELTDLSACRKRLMNAGCNCGYSLWGRGQGALSTGPVGGPLWRCSGSGERRDRDTAAASGVPAQAGCAGSGLRSGPVERDRSSSEQAVLGSGCGRPALPGARVAEREPSPPAARPARAPQRSRASARPAARRRGRGCSTSGAGVQGASSPGRRLWSAVGRNEGPGVGRQVRVCPAGRGWWGRGSARGRDRRLRLQQEAARAPGGPRPTVPRR